MLLNQNVFNPNPVLASVFSLVSQVFMECHVFSKVLRLSGLSEFPLLSLCFLSHICYHEDLVLFCLCSFVLYVFYIFIEIQACLVYCATLLSYKIIFFYKLKISGQPALLKPITAICSNCMCSFCLAHLGNSHGISNIFLIIVFVMAICVECFFM